MKNLGTLYIYELKKLLHKKLAWVLTVVVAALMVYTMWPRLGGGATFSLTDADGDTVSRSLTGAEQREQQWEGMRRISGQLMDEAMFQKIRDAAVGDGRYIIREHWEQVCYFYLIDSSYLGPYNLVRYDIGLDPATATAEQFYQARQENIDVQLANLTDGERAYWRDMEGRVEKPFVYRYSAGYDTILNGMYALSSMIPLLAAVWLCSLFSQEKRTRADTLIFSSRQGHLPQFLAKMLAGMTFTLAASLAVLGVYAVPILADRGMEGFDAAIQLWAMDSSLPLTVGQGALIMLGLLLLYALVSGGVTMALSALTKNSVAALVGPVLLMIGQARLRLSVQAADYLPDQLFNGTSAFRSFRLVHLFGADLNVLQFASILYAVLTVALLALCWLGWRRWTAGEN